MLISLSFQETVIERASSQPFRVIVAKVSEPSAVEVLSS